MSETALKNAIADELEKAGFVRKPGSSNEWEAPPSLLNDQQATMSVDLDPKPSAKKEKSVAEGNVAADQLRLFIERIERLEEEKKGISDDIRDVLSEAKANGYCTKTIRLMIRLRKMETHTLQERVAVAETYASALGIQHVLPL